MENKTNHFLLTNYLRKCYLLPILLALTKKVKDMVFSPDFPYLAPNNHAFLLYVNKLHSWYMCIERSGFYQTFLTSNNIHKIFCSVVKEFIIVK